MAPPQGIAIRSPLLNNEAGKFFDQATQLRNTVQEGEQVLTRLGKEGLGWDNTSGPAAVKFWKHQSKVLQALGDTVNLLLAINAGLYNAARAFPGADEEAAYLFRRLNQPLDVADSSSATDDLAAVRWRRRGER